MKGVIIRRIVDIFEWDENSGRFINLLGNAYIIGQFRINYERKK